MGPELGSDAEHCLSTHKHPKIDMVCLLTEEEEERLA
jgi:hypothetical protein